LNSATDYINDAKQIGRVTREIWSVPTCKWDAYRADGGDWLHCCSEKSVGPG